MNNAMTNEEICRDYRLAKQKVKQIGILADLNECTKKQIVEILKAGGEELPYIYQPHTQPRKQTTDAPPEAPEAPEMDDNETVSVREVLPFLVGQAALEAIVDLIDYMESDYEEQRDRTVLRIEGIVNVWKRIVERCEDD